MTGEVQSHLAAAFAALQTGDLDRAVALFTDVLSRDATIPEARYGLLRVRTARGEGSFTPEVESLLAQIVAAETPVFPPLLPHAATVCMQLGRFDIAAAVLHKILVAKPNRVPSIAALARCELALGNPAAAEKTARRALALEPNNAIALYVLARALAAQGHFAEAELQFIELTRAPAFLNARNQVIDGVVRLRDDADELLTIVRDFWPHYSAAIAGQDWFARAMAERETTVAAEDYRPETWPAERARSSPRHVTLVTYGSPPFRAAQERLARSALTVGEIDEALLWTRASLRETQYFRDHRALLERPRGDGYWAWKPFLIYNALCRRADGDTVIYYDCGRDDGYAFTKSARDLVAWCARDRRGFLPGALYPPAGRSAHWTKRDCFVLMGCDAPQFWNGHQCMATFSVWRNSPAARVFVQRWMNLALDPRIVSDHPNVCGLPDHDGFIDHREDQSILSNLVIQEEIALPAYYTADINGLAAILPPPR